MRMQDLKIVDCTVRDGGLNNNLQFDHEFVRAVFKACCDAGLDYCELGYKNSRKMFDPAENGAWRFSDEEDLVKATEGIDRKKSKISVMMDAHKSEPEDLIPSDDSVIDMVRVATYLKDLNKAIQTVKHAHELGYETAINIMAISHVYTNELEEALDRLEEETSAKVVYIVDSFGALYQDQLHFLISKYQMHLKTKEVGGHFHNHQQLAFANTIDCIIKDCTWVDSTLNGFGRAAGNCCTELLMGFVKNPDHNILPVLDVIGKHIIPLKQRLEWGYHIPYMITSALNQHPLAAMEQMSKTEDEGKHDYVRFYSSVDEVY